MGCAQFCTLCSYCYYPAHSGPRTLIQFRNHFSQTVGLLGRVISPSQGRYLHTEQHKHGMNVYTYQISMPWVGFEPTIPASERAKTVYVLDRAATMTDTFEPVESLYRFRYIVSLLLLLLLISTVAPVPKHDAIKTYLEPRRWSLYPFTPRLGDPRDGLDTVIRRKIRILWELNHV
jgi:hypothetical protein